MNTPPQEEARGTLSVALTALNESAVADLSNTHTLPGTETLFNLTLDGQIEPFGTVEIQINKVFFMVCVCADNLVSCFIPAVTLVSVCLTDLNKGRP